jgi:class I fructose-bisphosphate aldolase
MQTSDATALLGLEADYYLSHRCKTIDKSLIYIPSAGLPDDVWAQSDRGIPTLRSLATLFGNGRLAGTGYLSILAADHGAEHTAGAAFTDNPLYFDPDNILRLAIEAGCSAVASTFGALAIVARKYAHKIPFIVKINHGERLSYPNSSGRVMFGSVKEAWRMGAVAIGAGVDFGVEQGRRQMTEAAEAFEYAHELGMATVLWCYLHNENFRKEDVDYNASADITGQANHLGATLRADLVIQQLPLCNGGFSTLNFSAYSNKTYAELTTEHPIDLCRYQVANGYMGRCGLISAGCGDVYGTSSDLKEAVTAAVINKRAGGMGLATGRKALLKPMKEGIELLNALQDVYLDSDITIA